MTSIVRGKLFSFIIFSAICFHAGFPFCGICLADFVLPDAVFVQFCLLQYISVFYSRLLPDEFFCGSLPRVIELALFPCRNVYNTFSVFGC